MKTVDIDLMQRVWRYLYSDAQTAEENNEFQRTLDEVVAWLAERGALPALPPDLSDAQ